MFKAVPSGYLGGALALSSHVLPLFRYPWPEKPARKMIIVATMNSKKFTLDFNAAVTKKFSLMR